VVWQAIVLEAVAERASADCGRMSRFIFRHGPTKLQISLQSSAMGIRVMTQADIPVGMRLKEMAGWNQTDEDWKRFLQASPQGCFVAEVDGKVCGTATTIVYENRFAWIGMVLVDPEYRSRGFGTQLLKKAIQYLDALGISTIKLDATPQGKPIYEKLGFAYEYELERWILRRTATESAVPTTVDLTAKLLESILQHDATIFGANRGFLLKDLYRHNPQFTIGIERDGLVEAYCFGRRGSFADQLGPWGSADRASAGHVLATFLARSPRDTIVVDRVKSNGFTENLLRSAGFTYSRPLTRMVRGPNNYGGRIERLCAALGPEFG
jgi:GNAT superfamily N-acetyltransferase